MTLRARVTLATGLAVLLVVASVSVAVYFIVRGNLRDQVDDSLRHGHQDRVAAVTDHRLPSALPDDLPLVDQFFMQTLDRDGQILSAFDDRPLPVDNEVLAVVRGERKDVFLDAEVDGAAIRIYAVSTTSGTTVVFGRSLEEVERALRQLVLTHLAISIVAVALAAVIGRLVAATATGPVRRVAEAADRVARTGELSHHIAVPGGDDLGRLAASFNTMLDALSASLDQQRQLVADASHELRTPLATVRTNVEVLARADELSLEDRTALLGETVSQIAELTRLVGDLVELARGDGQDEAFDVVDLDEVVRRAVETVGRNHASVMFRVDARPTPVRGAPGRVARAVSNLIDNAAKWSPPGAEVKVTVRDGVVSVRDHGPGVSTADLPQVFRRFYRSPEARTMPGSGLGLAIVKQVADSHGGTVTASAAPGGGALFVLRFPVTSLPAPR